MLHPSIEAANPSATIAEHPAAHLRPQADSSKESPVAAASQTGEQDCPSPICAAGWAY
jgi:hypothetical protein